MTRDIDVERLMDRWLAEGPSQMPSRFLDDTLERINRAPDHRLRVIPRLPVTKNAGLRLAVAAVGLLLIVGVGLTVLSHSPAVEVEPSQTPSSTVTPSALQTKWTSVGDRPFLAGLQPASGSVEMTIDAATLSVNQFKGPVLDAWSLATPGDRLALTMSTSDANLASVHWDGCRLGQEAIYTVGMSPDGKILTLGVVDDPCAAQRGQLAGAWTRWPCANPKSVCMPALDAGAYVTPFLPSVAPGEQSFTPTYLTEYSYTVPSGWSQIDTFTLGRPNDSGFEWISFVPDVAAHSQDVNCGDAVEPGVAGTATALAHWLTGLPGLVTTEPVPIEIGGYPGQMLDLSVAPTWRIPCQAYFQEPARAVFTFSNPTPDSYSPYFVREYLQDDAHARYVLLDVGAGHNLLIDIVAPDNASWDEFVVAAMPIVQSLEFRR